MKLLIREAANISRDFGTATFVGAIAVMLHTGGQRQSQDLDFVVAEQITIDEFLSKGRKIDQQRDKKSTPRGYKIDVYHGRDLDDIPPEYIKTAAALPVDKNGTTVNAIPLEGLIVAKFGAGRDRDIEDLQRLEIRRGRKVNWGAVKYLAKSNAEYSEIEQATRLHSAR